MQFLPAIKGLVAMMLFTCEIDVELVASIHSVMSEDLVVNMATIAHARSYQETVHPGSTISKHNI